MNKMSLKKKSKAFTLIVVLAALVVMTLIFSRYLLKSDNRVKTTQLSNEENQIREELLSFMGERRTAYQQAINQCFQRGVQTELTSSSCPALESFRAPGRIANIRCLRELQDGSERSPCTIAAENLPKIFELTAVVSENELTRRGTMIIEIRFPEASDFSRIVRASNRERITMAPNNVTSEFSHCNDNTIESFYFSPNRLEPGNVSDIHIASPAQPIQIMTNLPPFKQTHTPAAINHCLQNPGPDCTATIQPASFSNTRPEEFNDLVKAVYNSSSETFSNTLIAQTNVLKNRASTAGRQIGSNVPYRMTIAPNGSNSCEVRFTKKVRTIDNSIIRP